MYVGIYTTISSLEAAKRLSHLLVEKKLVACVNIIPNILSIYRWKGQIEEEPEIIVWCKTQEALIQKVKSEILKSHPYELPAFAVYPIQSGSEAYLKWIDEGIQN